MIIAKYYAKTDMKTKVFTLRLFSICSYGSIHFAHKFAKHSSRPENPNKANRSVSAKQFRTHVKIIFSEEIYYIHDV